MSGRIRSSIGPGCSSFLRAREHFLARSRQHRRRPNPTQPSTLTPTQSQNGPRHQPRLLSSAPPPFVDSRRTGRFAVHCCLDLGGYAYRSTIFFTVLFFPNDKSRGVRTDVSSHKSYTSNFTLHYFRFYDRDTTHSLNSAGSCFCLFLCRALSSYTNRCTSLL